MSNITTGSAYGPTEFVKKELMPNEPSVKSEYETGCFYNTSSSVPKTILITNNYSQDDPSGLKNSQNIQKSSSITIVTHNSDGERSTSNIPTSTNSSTLVLDRINICINNHFNDSRSSSAPVTKALTATSKSEERQSDESLELKQETTDEPSSNTSSISSTSDSTIMSQQSDPKVPTYTTGEDVLVQRKDDRFYLGTIIAIGRNQCLVRLDDNTEYWSLFDEIKKLSTTEANDDPMCVVCKKINEDDIVEVCERCGRGYHQRCTEERFQKNGVWYCKRCTARNGLKFRQLHSPQIEPLTKVLTDKSQLPYDIDSLSWDSYHRVNLEQIYCYCGGNGEWHKKMLQCCKCQQWFHEKCVRCLDYPLYRGDRFFVFVCSMCNNGVEFLRRLVMKWIDIVHLLLFNITSYNQQKYYHVNKVIVPYAIDNWPFLHLESNMRSITAKDIKENILKTLSANKRFKCGREIKKRHSVWGLRVRIPPPAPIVILSPCIDVDEQYLRQRAKLDLISIRSTIEIPKDIELKMSGIEYLGENSDNESSGGISDTKFTSDDELPLKVSIEKEKQREQCQITVADEMLIKEQSSSKKLREMSPFVIPEDDSLGNDQTSPITDSSDKSRDCLDYNGGTDDADVEMKDDETIDPTRTKRNRKRKSPFLSSATVSCLDVAAKKHAEIIDICDSSDDTSSRGTLDLIIPPPKNFQGRNNPFRTTPKKNTNSTENNRPTITHRSSVNGGGSSSCATKNNVNAKSGKQQMLNSVLFGNVNLNQVSSKFTLVRTVKRRLSAKDLMIGPNKEVKRRRLKRRSGTVEVISTTTLQTLPKSAAYLPIRSENKEWPVSAIRSTLVSVNSSSSSSTPHATSPTNLGSISNVFNGRRLRQRQEKNYAESSRRNSNTSLTAPSTNPTSTNNISIPGSPNKSGGDQSNVSLSDLKSSVNMYFGAMTRISSGESFAVRAKRYAPNGKTQYLIEWEGIS